MFLVEKDVVIEPRNVNLNNSLNPASISNFIDTDRHKFDTFADALWWGIVCYRNKKIFLMIFLSISLIF